MPSGGLMVKDWKKNLVILIAEDDDDYYELTSSALADFRDSGRLRRVVNGEETMAYLLRQGEYADAEKYPTPGVVLLDLNMPRKDGRLTLREMRSYPKLRQIPVIILTVSRDEEDINLMYQLGANSFITKPVSYAKLEEAMKAIERYWFEISQLPRFHD